MKKFENFKIFQLTMYILYTIFSLFLLFNKDFKQSVFSNKNATMLFILIWVCLISGFIFIFLDYKIFSDIKSGMNILYGAAYSDNISDLPNRFSCDTIIEKYADKFLPADIACVMFTLNNLSSVNESLGHSAGNELIKNFSSILKKALLL